MDNLTISMIRDNLEDIPQFGLPSGYSFRWYRPGDEADWVRIQSLADQYNRISLELFFDQFGTDTCLIGERQVYVLDSQGVAIGTATAWFDPAHHGKPFGRLHWVALVPEAQGLGLAKPLMTAVCERLRALGHVCAYLDTSSARIPALNLYLKFGFQPEINDDQTRSIWLGLRDRLRYPINAA